MSSLGFGYVMYHSFLSYSGHRPLWLPRVYSKAKSNSNVPSWHFSNSLHSLYLLYPESAQSSTVIITCNDHLRKPA